MAENNFSLQKTLTRTSVLNSRTSPSLESLMSESHL